ncbi:hypothetical protein TNCV_3826601 [Trichonephila clavipes]|nr:hypothetical protein TNCV_3826601 [Trichonephila clavipes]
MSTPLAASPLQNTTTISNTIFSTSKDAKQTSKPRKKRPPTNTSTSIKPKMEIKMTPHKPRKPAPVEYTTDEEGMIVYDSEEVETTKSIIKGLSAEYWQNEVTSSEYQPPVPLVITTFASNSSSTSAASSSNKALSSSKVSMFTPLPTETCPVAETITALSKNIPSAHRDIFSYDFLKFVLQPNRSITPEIEIQLTPHKQKNF